MRELAEPDVSMVRAAVEESMTPAPDNALTVKLGAMWLSMAHEKRDTEDSMTAIRVYVRKLRDFPHDIVMDLLNEWHEGRHGDFFPTAPALVKELDGRCLKRRHLLDELKAWGSPHHRKRRLAILKMDLEYLQEGRPLPPIRSFARETWPEWEARLERQIQQLEALEG